ncbi:hypothetical protein E3N88_06679 [Mikania micrantha]|uniref:Uncharacterized protein n=1 Tax=Mikania micrantha TaxID=192012 RepID=A0A5N6PPE2_9ASTR|nr:hypothetical protein E3N88_06679 [Mikania micrantha]
MTEMMLTETLKLPPAQLAKTRANRLGSVTLNTASYEVMGLKWSKVRSLSTAGESRGHWILRDWICSTTWIHESRVHKKNPILERSGSDGEKEIWERLTCRWPEWVKPNSLIGMVDRESDRISVRRISADVKVKRGTVNGVELCGLGTLKTNTLETTTIPSVDSSSYVNYEEKASNWVEIDIERYYNSLV